MAYDQTLAQRLQGHLDGELGITQKRMFGGLAFLVNGNMAISASGQGGLMVRVEAVQTDDELLRWVGCGVNSARTLPPK